MKVVFEDNNIVKGGENKGEIEFGIGNSGFIMDILSAKIYSNPIKAIIQEVCSNALDANVENKNGDKPIVVKLPDFYAQDFYIQDFGVGISPDRMANIFTQYGCSTKRRDNNQIGGFGLGAKTPFAYTDSFGILTISKDAHFTQDGKNYENCNVQRQYMAYIDTDRSRKLRLVSEKVTEEVTGTKIFLTSKPNDKEEFKKWLKFCCRYWTVKPEVKGSANFTWDVIKKEFEGKDWFIPSKKTDYYAQNETPTILVGNIPYQLSANQLNLNKNWSQISTLFNWGIHVQLKIGEVTLTANREELDYQPKVIDTIVDKILEVKKELKVILSDKIKGAKNLWEANIKWAEYSNTYYGLIDAVDWNGIPVTSGYQNTQISYEIDKIDVKTNNVVIDPITQKPVRVKVTNGVSVISYTKSYNGKIKSYSGWEFSFKNDTILLWNDVAGEPNVNPKRIKTIFENNPTINSVIVISSPDEARRTEFYGLLDKKLHLSKMGHELMSSYDKYKAVKGAAGTKKAIADLKQFDPSAYYIRDSFKSVTQDPNNPILNVCYAYVYNSDVYLEYDEKETGGFSNQFKHKVSIEVLKKTINAMAVDLYLIPIKGIKTPVDSTWVVLKEKMGKWIEDEIKNQGNKTVTQTTYLCDKSYNWSSQYNSTFGSIVKSWSTIKGKITDKDKLFETFVGHYNDFQNNLNKTKRAITVELEQMIENYNTIFGTKKICNVNIVDNKVDIDDLVAKIYKKYPLLEKLNLGSYYFEKAKDLEPIIDYMTLIDNR